MKYFKKAESDKLISKYESQGNFEDISQVINFLIDNIDSLLKFSNNNFFYNSLERILEITFGKDEERFKNMCSKVLAYGDKHQLSEEAIQIRQSLINLRSLLDGNISLILPNIKSLDKNIREFRNVVSSIVGEHYHDLRQRFKEERNLALGRLLHQKSLEDGRAMKKGQRLHVEEQEGYKLLKRIQAGKI